MIVQKLLGQSFEVGYNAMYDRIENLIEVRLRWAGLGWDGMGCADCSGLPSPRMGGQLDVAAAGSSCILVAVACCCTVKRVHRPLTHCPLPSHDCLQAGVLDPAKVTRSGLTNACSIAGIMLTTQVR